MITIEIWEKFTPSGDTEWRLRVDSAGNGIMVDFVNETQGKSVFFQGDDAARFLNKVDDANGHGDVDAVWRLWQDYEHIAAPHT